MTLNKRIGRSIKHHFSFFLLSILLTTLTVAFIISAVSTGRVLTDVMADFMTAYHTENAEFTVYSEIPDDEIENLEQEFNILLEQNRYKDITYENTTIRVFARTEKVNQYQVHTGNDLASSGDLLLTERYATVHGYSVGDTLRITDRDFTICGYAVKSDYIYMLQSLNDSYRNNELFALAIVSDSDFDVIEGTENCFYGIIFQEDNALAVRKALNDRYILRSYMSNQSNTRISLPLNEGAGVQGMAMVFGPVLFLMVIILIALLLSRRIKAEQSLIGTFIALGYRKGEIVRHYTYYGFIPGLTGSALGLLLSAFFTKALSKFYIENDFEKLSYTMHYSIPAVITGMILPVALYVLTTILVTRIMLKKNAVDLLRHTDKKPTTVQVFTKSRFKTRTKLRFRSILGHILRSLITVLGVTVATIAVLMGLMMYSSMQHVLHYGVTDSTCYQYQYVLNHIADTEPKQGERLLTMAFEVENSTVQVTLNGIEEDSAYFTQQMNLEDYTVTSAAAQVYGLDVGSSFTFRNPVDLKKQTVTVGAVIEDNLHCSIYTGMENAARIIGVDNGSYNSIISDNVLSVSDDEIATVISIRSTQDSLRELMSPIMVIVYLVVLIGVVLCTFVMYLVMNVVVSESKTQISLMKILGYRKREIGDALFSMNHILLVIGYLIGIPLAYLVCSFAMRDSMNEYGICMQVILNLFDVVLGFVAVGMGYLLSLTLQKQKAYNVDMTLTLRDARRD